ncbi:exported hypothetical protein [Thiomonas delicata]|uniref:Nucleoside transporter/FeoB GTPase Gate domain-containing protein n=1 Tax=Thiomonas delicata TaxID=364030 RepID=A0A238D5A8_THIDL|nr:exported hypothetical protein [Thiomonas delicata]
MLNRLWLGFFLTAALAALVRWLAAGDAAVFGAVVDSLFAMAKLSVEVMVLLFGTLTLWLGLLRIAERAGLVDALARLLGPLFRRLMPEVPAGHPAIGLITLNFAANMLGLDNAATPSACARCANCRPSTRAPTLPATRRSCSWCSTPRRSPCCR